MNVKKWVIASIVVFLVSQILEFIIHFLILGGAYEATSHIWRPEAEMNQLMWLMWLVGLIWSFLFVYIFAQGREGKGLMEGIRFGIIIGLFYMIPMSLGNYAAMPIPFSLALSWLIYGILELIILGILVALLYKPNSQSTAAA